MNHVAASGGTSSHPTGRSPPRGAEKRPVTGGADESSGLLAFPQPIEILAGLLAMLPRDVAVGLRIG